MTCNETDTNSMQAKNSILDDISAVIGFTATVRLVNWFGGGNLYIPMNVSEDHPLVKLIGLSSYQKLVENYRGQYFTLPTSIGGSRMGAPNRDQVKRQVMELRKTLSVSDVAKQLNISERMIYFISKEMKESGLVEMPPNQRSGNPQLKAALFMPPGKASGKIPPGKAPGKTPPEKAPQKGPRKKPPGKAPQKTPPSFKHRIKK